MTLNVRVNVVDIATVPIGVPNDQNRKLAVRAMDRSQLIAADISYGFSSVGVEASFPVWEDSYCIGVRFNDERADIFVDGKAYTTPRRSNETHIMYLSGVEHIDLQTPRHTQEILLKRSFMREIADDMEVPHVAHLGRTAFHVTDDPLLRGLAIRVYPYFDAPETLEPLLADHYMWALGIYVCVKFGGMDSKRPVTGGLSTWQERLAKDVMETKLVGGIGLGELAALCGLGTSHFSHSFRRSTGMAPYQWLMLRRVARAKQLLRHRQQGIADIALACGFADQSHLIRNFSRLVGTTPARWRRQLH
jgi:AraC family transcriptional regulator